MKTISSLTNPFIKQVAALHLSKYRQEYGLFMVEGLRASEPFLNSSFRLHALLVADKHLSWAQDLVKKGIIADEEMIVLVTPEIMEKVSGAESPSGIVAVFEIPQQPEKVTLRSGIVLAQIQDPGNMGTLLRTAAAFGKMAIVIEGVDIYNPKVIQASAGAVATGTIVTMSWDAMRAAAKEQNFSCVALVVAGGTLLPERTHQTNQLIVVGNEAHGLPFEWAHACEEKVTIPMPGKTESLNAAIAGSIALYEISRADIREEQ